jgi:hypothetical protein
VVLSSIVLMNLMVGLAVNDIQVICIILTKWHIVFQAYHTTLTLHGRLRSEFFPYWMNKFFGSNLCKLILLGKLNRLSPYWSGYYVLKKG